ncbi:MAG: TonB-dependent receptor [Pseudomonadales bacterium]|nr:TonB-dependent receptor [Pseudomonadales bacterium]
MPRKQIPCKSIKVHRFLISTLAAAIAGVTSAAYVQAQEEAGALEEIQITGSRIRAPGLTAPTPVTSVGVDELSRMAPGNLIESISQLPQFFNNATQNNPGNFFTSPGSGGLNIRGLGTNRTLVLLDGRRSPPANRQGTSDINVFPEALIQRLEVVTGGASASYGTDAVAGVANFILNKEFTGVDTHLQGGATTRGDNENWEGSFSFGADISDRMHLLFSVEAFQQNRVTSFDDRKWFQSYGTVTNPDPTGPRDLILPNVVSTQATVGGIIRTPGLLPNGQKSSLDFLQFLSDGTVTPFILSDVSIVGAGTRSQSITNGGSGTLNSNLRPTLAPEAERANAFTYLDYDVTDNLNVYVQGLWGKNQSTSTNLGGTFENAGFNTELTIFPDNAFLPEAIRQTMLAEGLESFKLQRLGGPEDLAATAFTRTETNTFSGTVGFDLTIDQAGFFQDWQVHSYYQAGRNKQRGRQQGGIRIDRVVAAVDAVADPVTGSVVCRAALIDPANFGNCVPLNLFGAGRASPEALDFVTDFDRGQEFTTPIFFSDSGLDLGVEKTFNTDDGAKRTVTNTTEHLFELSADGELYDGWGAGALSLATGISWRREQITQLVVDPTNPMGNFTLRPVLNPALRGIPPNIADRGQTIQFATVPNLKGSFEVKEAFGEMLVPVVSDLPFVQQFNLTLAGRFADYTGSGTVWAWKFGGDWQVNDELRIRTTGSHDVRAATLAERLDRTGAAAAITDPEFNNNAFSVSLVSGGNPNVEPEEADTVTVGAIYQPSWLSGFSATVDYYRIHLSGAIGQLGVQRIVDDCFAGAQGLCERITRDPATNQVLIIEDVFLNIAETQTEGIDVEFNYNTPLTLFGGDAESLNWRFLGTWLNENSITNPGAPKVERAGETGVLSLPEFKFTTNLTYNNGPITVFVQERWIDQGLLDGDETTGVEISDNKVRGAFYTDLRLSYNADNDDGSSWEVYGTVTNLLDENPPVTAGFSTFTATASQTNQSLFDVLGRRFVAGVRFRY